jgi:DNA repair photolyase
MIISASRKTDIPAFYSEWFMNRFRAGSCKMRNSYNQQVYDVDLSHPSGFVFWTKNLEPLVEHLGEVRKRAPFMVQYTINNYPKAIEPNVPELEDILRTVREVSERYGAETVVWRYDPIFLSTLTTPEFHVENFEKIAENLTSCVNEAIISFAQGYQKTIRNVRAAMERHDFVAHDPTREEKKEVLGKLLRLARRYGMKLSVCSQPEVHIEGVEQAHCADAQRLTRIAGTQIQATFAATRKSCGCFESRDIGSYNTCRHDCIYCYATENPELAEQRRQGHDPTSEFLFED